MQDSLLNSERINTRQMAAACDLEHDVLYGCLKANVGEVEAECGPVVWGEDGGGCFALLSGAQAQTFIFLHAPRTRAVEKWGIKLMREASAELQRTTGRGLLETYFAQGGKL